jgi:hypothetical protein
MSISVNKSPLAGREGKLLQSRVIRDRLFKELDRNVALKVCVTLITELSHHSIFLIIVVDWLHTFRTSFSNDIYSLFFSPLMKGL